MRLFGSIHYAWRGIRYTVARERNVRVQLLCALLAVAFGYLLGISVFGWLFVSSAIGLVLCLEFINSAVEKLVDVVKPRLHDQVGVVKDIMAGAVLLASVYALIVGIVIFCPRLIEYAYFAWYTMKDL